MIVIRVSGIRVAVRDIEANMALGNIRAEGHGFLVKVCSVAFFRLRGNTGPAGMLVTVFILIIIVIIIVVVVVIVNVYIFGFVFTIVFFAVLKANGRSRRGARQLDGLSYEILLLDRIDIFLVVIFGITNVLDGRVAFVVGQVYRRDGGFGSTPP